MSQIEPKPIPQAKDLSQAHALAIVALVFGFLSFCLPVIGTLVAIVCAVIAIVQINASGGKLAGKGMAIAGAVLGVVGTLFNVLLLIALLLPAIQMAREAAKRAATGNNLKMIGVAMHNYHDAYRTLPPNGAIYEASDAGGAAKRTLGLSWRVRILPFVDNSALYEEFDQNVPWDHPHNMRLIDRMPRYYRSPNRPIDDGKTVYLGVVYPAEFDPKKLPEESYQAYLGGTAFDWNPARRRPGMLPISLADIVDGTANTIAVVEADADQAVIWTKPDDWEFDVAHPARGLGGLRPNGIMALFLDGRSSFVRSDLSHDNLRRLFCRNDGQRIDALSTAP